MASKPLEYITVDALTKLSVTATPDMQKIAQSLLREQDNFRPVWIVGCEGEDTMIRAYDRGGGCIGNLLSGGLRSRPDFDLGGPLTSDLMSKCLVTAVSKMYPHGYDGNDWGQVFKYTGYSSGFLIVPTAKLYRDLTDIIDNHVTAQCVSTGAVSAHTSSSDDIINRIQAINRSMDALHKERAELCAEVNARCEKH